MIDATFFQDKQVVIRLTDGTTAQPDAMQITRIWAGGSLRVNIKNTNPQPVRIKEIALFAGDVPLPADTRFYAEGYHMLSQYRGDFTSIECIGAYGDDKSFFHLPDNPYDEGCHVVYYLLELIGETQRSLIAFASCHKFLGKFRLREGYLEIVMDAEDIALQPGEAWDMEELIILTGPERQPLYEQLAAAINQNHPPLALPKGVDTIPTGWCSYYCMGIMSPEGLYENAKAMAERIPELKMIQIDAGLAANDGDWLTPSFDDDLEAACKKVRAYGVDAGGYCSPFLVGTDSQLYVDHPDWLIHDEDGNPTSRRSHRPDWCILDGTHPEAREFLREIARYMHGPCGLRYYKLDFLSYGALPAGRHYDESKTSVEAYRMGLKAMIDEVADDSFILACNAPFWPTLGLAHGNRTTNDIFRDWKHVGGNALEQFYRNWQHERLWANDPDCILLEKLDIIRMKNGQPSPRPCTLTDDEFAFHKAFAIATGGMLLSGDLLYELSDENIEALRKMIDARGEAAVFDSDAFEVGRFAQKNLLCLFNWEAAPKQLSVSLDAPCRLVDFWTGEPLGTYTDTLTITMNPHGGRVLKIEQEDTGR